MVGREYGFEIYEFRVLNRDKIDTDDLEKAISEELRFGVRVRQRANIQSDERDNIGFLVYNNHCYTRAGNDPIHDIVNVVRKVCSARELDVNYLGEYRIPIVIHERPRGKGLALDAAPEPW